MKRSSRLGFWCILLFSFSTFLVICNTDTSRISPSSETLGAATSPCPAPGPPGLVCPPMIEDPANITLEWREVLGSTSYEVQVCTEAECNVVVSQATVHNNQSKIPQALSPGKYWFRVRAVNSCGPGSWNTPCSFNICTPLEAASLKTPAGSGVTMAPTLDWRSVSGAVSYDVQVCSDFNCSSVVRLQSGLTKSQWAVTPALNRGKRYWWRARANNSCGRGTWPATSLSFTTTLSIVDFDGDGKTDIAAYQSDKGIWLIISSSKRIPYEMSLGGDSNDIPVAGDYDGDGKTDMAVYRAGKGGVWLIHSSSKGLIEKGWGGMAGDIPVPGDYDGDGKTDIAIYRPAWKGAWLIDASSAGFIGKGWGGMDGDIPVPGDYDGDGKTDVAIYRTAWGGAWLIDSSSKGLIEKGWGGMDGDIPVPGDYDGDGKTDIAIYRKAWGGAWLIDGSTAGYIGKGWGGMDGDIPVPGDYDGDGKTDIAIYRSSKGEWHILPSSTGVPYIVVLGGRPSDIPVK